MYDSVENTKLLIYTFTPGPVCVGKERVQMGKLYFSGFLNLKVVQRHSNVIAYRPGS